MLDINYIRQNPEELKRNIKNRGLDPQEHDVDRLLEVDRKRRGLLKRVEALRKERNEIAKSKNETAFARGKEIKQELKELEPQLKDLQDQCQTLINILPNLAAPDVPVGKDESENVVLKKWGEPKKFAFEPQDHLEIGESLGIIDVNRAGKVSGSRFGYLKGDLVLLEFALINLAFKTLTGEGFIPIIPPVLIKKEMMRGMGYLEHGGEEEMYLLNRDGLVLVGTSEQSIGPMHKDEVFDAKDLPRRYVGFSTCFRREAGSYGKDTRGILRVHQFNKVEMFSYTVPKNGDEEHEFLLSLEERLMQKLKIPYQVVQMCTGDLGTPAARKYDIEAFLPGQSKYREVTSTSTTTDFQARRLNIKYKEGGKVGFVHMLNGTAFSERPLIAILENYQQENGSVTVPEVLREFVGKKVITPRNAS